ncbi:YhdP family phospholipid transporter [Halomonas caseinilytica]|uniref:TIGR02099 family protein n=1 Tax=Halomonas caseinilytica TaxID=438744 RepID=A0A1M6X1U5_9GAMM|nr:AsmA-like C-terminal region-containing protein [Halomonas caseinilytica]SHK99928.1 TIGR02099 family protein [Halomonas caseinilytica]
MSPSRLVIRWSLTLLALALTLAAILLIVLRLLLGQVDRLAPHLESMLASRFSAEVSLNEARGGVDGLDPWFEIADLDFRSRKGLGDVPLLEIEQATLRLDTAASLRRGMPVLERSRLAGVTLHLYQDEDLSWQWPAPADVPPELVPAGEFDLSRLDFWIGVLLRQRAWADDMRVVLHGRKRVAVLHAPRLLMTGDEQRAHLEGEVRLQGRPGTAFQAVMELTHEAESGAGFDALLQADMQLESLIGLSALLGFDDKLRLDDASGEARLWGRWQDGRLADVRLDVSSPRLALNRDLPAGEEQPGIVLDDMSLRGQWLRDAEGEGWEAWFAGDARSVDSPYEHSDGPPLPRFWHARGEGGDWRITGSGFELGALSAWRDRLPLPEGLARTVQALSPRGQVNALGLGRRDGQWQARVSATDVSVSPWEDAPGGGPLDIWLEADGTEGKVRFVDSGGAELAFPEVFAAPMSLDSASGEVVWSYAGARSFVSGRDLAVEWNGASVEGAFGLATGGDEPGGFGLQLDFRNVDALNRPLTDWLPMPVLREEVDADLADWLASGLAGRVPQGALSLHVPIAETTEAETSDEATLQLELDIAQGHLPFDPEWPALEAVSGHLSVNGDSLEAEIEHAESLGVLTEGARVEMADEVLRIRGPLSAKAASLSRYLAAIPADGMEAIGDWRGEGEVTGELDMTLPLSNPEALALDIDGQATMSTLTHAPTSLTFESLSGPLAWRQRGEEGGLSGRLTGRLLGGAFEADVDTAGEGVVMSGTATADALIGLGAPPGTASLIRGETPWQGRLSLDGPSPTLTLNSELRGLGIALPDPLGKAPSEPRPLHLEISMADRMRLSGRLGDDIGLRWRGGPAGRGQVWLGRDAPPDWPAEPGWSVQAYLPRLSPAAWGEALSPLVGSGAGGGGDAAANVSRVTLDTDCLSVGERCLGSLIADGSPSGDGWRLALDGSLLSGRLAYRPHRHAPLDIALDRLRLDDLLPDGTAEPASQDAGQLFQELDVPPTPVPMLDGIGKVPSGRLSIESVHWRSQRFGPFSAGWRTTSDQLILDPVELSLGEVDARGNLTWEASGSDASLTRSRLSLEGGDIGTALHALDQPVAVNSAETRVASQLAWPGAPWQFALARSRGNLGIELRDGRFANLESPSARLVGLLNVDNLLRRLRLDFSDVTGRGTAFDSVSGDATLYGGVLETRGPVTIDGAATQFTLEGSVDLARRELDQRLGVTVPVSNNLPLAAVIAGAPVVGGALFVADKIFGDVIDRVTRIHYRVRGPWTSPRISLESAE